MAHIDSGMIEKFHFGEPEWHEEVHSTNTLLRTRVDGGAGLSSGAILAAMGQSRGKGRRGNAWHSPPGAGLYLSFLWRGGGDFAEVGTLPMAVALGVGDFLAGLGLAWRCRWPNDILVGEGKIAGIIAEASIQKGAGVSLVVGVGVNLNRAGGWEGVPRTMAVCLEDHLARTFAPRETLPLLLPGIEARINVWMRGGFAALREDFAANLWGMGRTVTVRALDGIRTGAVLGVNDDGELRVRTADGEEVAVTSAAALDIV